MLLGCSGAQAEAEGRSYGTPQTDTRALGEEAMEAAKCLLAANLGNEAAEARLGFLDWIRSLATEISAFPVTL